MIDDLIVALAVPLIALRSGIPLRPWLKIVCGIILAFMPYRFMPEHYPLAMITTSLCAFAFCALLYLADLWLHRQAHIAR